ncbi:tetratricopeptide repeat protein [Indioceanicola profundi]|uniref:tetratricopeptide repeat protein n=1 Tax=Indioceanicola profundi TaxID=2220096 RepID=UPI000E6ACDA5|nr:tetratricopeptide repeat protein [Indioceanicola profundi]
MTDQNYAPRSSRRNARWLLAALLALPVVGAGVSGTAFAQQQGGEEKKQETTQGQVLTERTFKQLTEANKAIEESRFKDAAPILDRLIADDRLTPYEKAIAFQTRAHLYTEMDDYRGAAAMFEKALALNILPPDQQMTLIYNLGQIYAGTEQYQKAVDKFKLWFSQAQNPQASAYLPYANSLFRLDRPKEAIPLVEKAIQISDDPKREWYDFLAGLYYETKQIDKVGEVLELLISKYPSEKRYYNQLAGVYSELKRERDMLAIMELAHKAGHLEKSTEFVQLAQLWMYFENPYRAAALLDDKLKKGQVDSTKENWELLANAWIASREIPKSIDPLARAAELDSKGEGFVRLAQAYLEREDWNKAHDALQKAINKGGLEKRGQVFMLEGVALFNLDRIEDSRRAFLKAAESKEQQRVASQWVRHIDKMLEEKAARQAAAVQ